MLNGAGTSAAPVALWCTPGDVTTGTPTSLNWAAALQNGATTLMMQRRHLSSKARTAAAAAAAAVATAPEGTTSRAEARRAGRALSAVREKRAFFETCCTRMMSYPRQARDRHRES